MTVPAGPEQDDLHAVVDLTERSVVPVSGNSPVVSSGSAARTRLVRGDLACVASSQ